MAAIKKRALVLAEVTFDEAFEIDAGNVGAIHMCIHTYVHILHEIIYTTSHTH